MMTDVEQLRFFNQKVERLRAGRFVKALSEEGFGVQVSFSESGTTTVRKGPDEEAVQAAVLTLRFFIQDNEPCSLRNLAKIYEDLRIPEDLRRDFREYRSSFNDYMDSPGRINVAGNQTSPRGVFEAVIYGDLSHSNPEKKKLFERLFQTNFISAISLSEFMNAMIVLVRLVFCISYLNRRVMEGKYLEPEDIGG